MNTPAAAPSQPIGGIQPDIIPQSPPAVTWITFGGSLGESSGDFIQAIQRVAFQQGHARDDHWIADYISTCFNGTALHWYSELDEETQDNWRKLRSALLKRFPATSPGPAPVTSTRPPETSAPRNLGYPPALNTAVRSGCIEVVGGRTTSLGYLYLDSRMGVGITTIPASASIVNFPAQPSSEPSQISLSYLPGNENANFPNIGLALLTAVNADSDQIPAEIKIFRRLVHGFVEDYEREEGIPCPSAMCKSQQSGHSYGPAMATWTLSLCGDSKPAAVYRRRAATEIASQRAAAAIWKCEKGSNELRIRWLMDDDTECELGGYIQRKSSTHNLHVHRIKDMQEAGRFFEENRVRFVFQPHQ